LRRAEALNRNFFMLRFSYSQPLISRWMPLAAFSISMAFAIGCQSEMDRGPVANLTVSKTYREALITGGEAGENAAATSTGTGWATIRGQFVYDGTAPKPAAYKVDKEHDICSINGQSPPQETLVVDSGTGGIKNVAIYLRDAKRVHESATAKEEPVVFDQKHCVFLTHVLAATVGQTIDIKNSDPTGHNTNILGTGFNQLIPDGGSIPYYAVTDNEGRFEIANVPAGEPIEFQVWHESGAAAGNGLVGVTPDATELKWSNRGRVAVTLQPDEVKEIKVVVPPGAFRG
jgi:hypothetical protein